MRIEREFTKDKLRVVVSIHSEIVGTTGSRRVD